MEKQKKPTEKQAELIILIAAKPYGMGLTLTQAANILGITYDGAQTRLRVFKKNFPERWKELQAFIREMEVRKNEQKQSQFDSITRKNLKNANRYGDMSKFEEDSVQNDPNFRIKEKF
jgi:hypothetical protein